MILKLRISKDGTTIVDAFVENDLFNIPSKPDKVVSMDISDKKRDNITAQSVHTESMGKKKSYFFRV